MKKILFLSLGLIAVASMSACTLLEVDVENNNTEINNELLPEKNNGVTNELEPEIQNAMQVVTKNFSQKYTYENTNVTYKYDINYPELVDKKESEVVKKVNSKIKEYVDGVYKEIMENLPELESKGGIVPVGNFEYNPEWYDKLSFEVTEHTEDIFSVRYTRESYIGQVRPRWYNETFTFDLNTGGLINQTTDLSFLKIEDKKENLIYSPLSIKYALKMLEEGAVGETKNQISNVISNEKITKYTSNSNMSLANALFVKDTFKENVKQEYIDKLKNEYDADVVFDSFKTPENVNKWISDKTLNLVNNLFDEITTEYVLVNALGIDMEWKEKFLHPLGTSISYTNEKGNLYIDNIQVMEHAFDNQAQKVSGMYIGASLNNYDILKELGEENIRKIVGDEYRKWAKSLTDKYVIETEFNNDLSDENIERKLSEYLDKYIKGISTNYKRVDESTEFSVHVDDSVKVFAKDLKEYNGTTLQYIGIMPINEDLNAFTQNIDDEKLNNIVSNLKELKSENFKEGVVTQIEGFIPKFKFEYELNLKEDLKQLGINNAFEKQKAELTNMTVSGDYISEAKHKANIEFTQDGIKAAAATIFGGAGEGGPAFEYFFDVPIEKIDLTFDKPYMFIIRDKENGQIWFVGTVYNPLSWAEEPENNLQNNGNQ